MPRVRFAERLYGGRRHGGRHGRGRCRDEAHTVPTRATRRLEHPITESLGLYWYRRMLADDFDPRTLSQHIETRIRSKCPRLRHTSYEDATSWREPEL